ncbi:MAG: ABC transporter substrate-binding protein [Oscillospiraceae bacterium]|nr:ABC transporter substrate-binding protein [Oscillospiraceae bacterium]
MKRTVSLLLALLILLSAAACSNSANKEPKLNKDRAEKTRGPSITVKDSAGLDVKLPQNTNKLTASSSYAVVTPYFAALKMSDRVMAAAFKNKAFLSLVDPVIVQAGNIGTGNTNLELLAKIGPDVFICKETEKKDIEAVRKLGITVVTVNAETAQDVMKTFNILGSVFGVKNRSDQIVEYINSKLEMIDGMVNKIPKDKRKTAVVMSSEIGRVAGGDMLQAEMLKRAGAINCTDGISNKFNWSAVGMEKIFEWNPDFIFATSSSVLNYRVDDLYKDKSWSAMKAVLNKNLIQIPAKKDSWDLPGPAFILGIMYMVNRMYPQYLSNETLKAQIDEFYLFMYGKKLDAKTIGYVLN